jgi:hypothetical protein
MTKNNHQSGVTVGGPTPANGATSVFPKADPEYAEILSAP